MSAVGPTRAGRRKAESLMVDTCVIKPVTGHTTNPDGTVSPTYGDPVYQGKCKLQQQSSVRYASNPNTGEHTYTVGPMELHLPLPGTGQVSTDDRVEITESFDGLNTGRTFRVQIGSRKTFATAFRLLVEEVVS